MSNPSDMLDLGSRRGYAEDLAAGGYDFITESGSLYEVDVERDGSGVAIRVPRYTSANPDWSPGRLRAGEEEIFFVCMRFEDFGKPLQFFPWDAPVDALCRDSSPVVSAELRTADAPGRQEGFLWMPADAE